MSDSIKSRLSPSHNPTAFNFPCVSESINIGIETLQVVDRCIDLIGLGTQLVNKRIPLTFLLAQ